MFNSISYNMFNNMPLNGSIEPFKEKTAPATIQTKTVTHPTISATVTTKIPQYNDALKAKYALNISSNNHISIPQKLSQIRTPFLRRVRTEQNLTTRDLKFLIDFQMQSISPKKIQEFINTFPQQDRNLASNLMIKMSQFGNMNSFNELINSIKKVSSTNTIFREMQPSLGNSLDYLANNKHAFDQNINFSYDEGILLLDEISLHKLENNNAFRKKITDNKILLKIGVMEGWLTGFNPFNQASKDFKKCVNENFHTLKDIIKNNPNLSQDEAIKMTLNKPILDKLKALGITNEIKIIDNIQTKTSTTKKEIPAVKIANQLNHNSMNKADLDCFFNKFDNKFQPYIKEIIAQDISINSPKTLSLKLQRLHKKIMNYCNDEKGLYYYIPKHLKSYSTVLMQYMVANNKYDLNILVAPQIDKLPNDAKRICILDDIAGSGDSLIKAYSKIKSEYNCENLKEVILAPIMSSSFAQDQFNDLYKGRSDFKVITTQHFHNFTDKKYYKTLPSFFKRMYDLILGESGYAGQAFHICFPYMSPDNDSKFFSKFMAENFTLNGAGVKGLDDEVFLDYLLKPTQTTSKISFLSKLIKKFI